MTDRPRRHHIRGSERGQAAPLALVALLFAALLCVGVVRVGDAAGRRAGAQASADAVALAAAAGGEPAAAEVAAANGARLVHLADEGDDVQVTIRQRGTTATARARWLPAPIP